MKEYTLNDKMPALGIFREDFVTPFEAYVLASSCYHGKELKSLLKFNPRSKDYFYEDDNILIIDHAEPTKKSSLSITIKPIFFFERDNVIVYLDTDPRLEIIDSCNTSISYKMCDKKTDQYCYGCFVTPDYYIKMLQRIKNDTRRMASQDLLLPKLNIEVVKELSFVYVKYLLTKIIRIPAGA